MPKCKLLSVVATFSSIVATPVLAQAAIQEPGAYAFYRPYGDLGGRNTLSGPREASGVGRRVFETVGAMASTRNSRWDAHASVKRHRAR